jgi:xanthine/uracil permease
MRSVRAMAYAAVTAMLMGRLIALINMLAARIPAPAIKAVALREY